jgi:hypothetical protein
MLGGGQALLQEMKRTGPHPIASVPRLPAGYEMLTDASRGGLLPWRWAVERLTKAHSYWIGTVRPDGRPHLVPVWGCWLNDQFMFSTSRDSVKAHNIARNPNCVLCPENAAEAIMVEGKVEEVTDRALLGRYLKIYNAKYNWNQDVTPGAVLSRSPRARDGVCRGRDRQRYALDIRHPRQKQSRTDPVA